jgi:predicted aldo/keto reductase-like oxidoreductase
MVSSKAKTAQKYLEELDTERREIIENIRKIILERIPKGFVEEMQYGMICYNIPIEKYPNTYNKKALTIAAIASQKNYISLYLMGIYADKEMEKWFKGEMNQSNKKMKMGKSCINFKKIEDLDLELIKKVIEKITPEKYIQMYEKSRKN